MASPRREVLPGARLRCPECLAVFRTGYSYCPLDGATLVVCADEPLLGTTISERYVIEEAIGEGAMGVVYRAHHVRLPRAFAVKVLFGDLAVDPVMRMRFAQEAAAAGRLAHRNVVPVVDFGRSERGLLYLVMDHVDGETLGDLMAREGPLGDLRVAELGRELARGLAHAHAHGLVHRDFKPENVMLERRCDGPPVPRILDFGLAISSRGEDEGARLTQHGFVVGTPVYLAPEQARELPIDHRADLYALGVVLYEMLAGRAPFEGEAVDVAQKNVLEPPPPIRAHNPELAVAPELEALVMRLLEKSPDDRYQSADEVAAALGEIARRLGGRSSEGRLARAAAPARAAAGGRKGFGGTGPAAPRRAFGGAGQAVPSRAFGEAGRGRDGHDETGALRPPVRRWPGLAVAALAAAAAGALIFGLAGWMEAAPAAETEDGTVAASAAGAASASAAGAASASAAGAASASAPGAATAPAAGAATVPGAASASAPGAATAPAAGAATVPGAASASAPGAATAPAAGAASAPGAASASAPAAEAETVGEAESEAVAGGGAVAEAGGGAESEAVGGAEGALAMGDSSAGAEGGRRGRGKRERARRRGPASERVVRRASRGGEPDGERAAPLSSLSSPAMIEPRTPRSSRSRPAPRREEEPATSPAPEDVSVARLIREYRQVGEALAALDERHREAAAPLRRRYFGLRYGEALRVPAVRERTLDELAALRRAIVSSFR